MRALVLSIGAALVFAGCVGGSADDGTAPSDGGMATAAVDPTSRTATPSPEAASPEPARVETDIAVGFDGNVGQGAWACVQSAGSMSCRGTGLPTSEAVMHHDPQLEGGVLGYHLELTWDATTPAAETLRLVLQLCTEDGCEWFDEAGPSPLVLHGTSDGMWSAPVIYVLPVGQSAGPATVFIQDGQAFSVSGSLRMVTPAGAIQGPVQQA